LLALACTLVLLAVPIGAEATGADTTAQASNTEYTVKAACLFKFIGYVKWPANAFADEKTPITVAVVGPDPFGQELEKAFADKKVGGRKIEIKRFKTTADIESCHLLFVASQETPNLAKILKAVAKRSVLVVTESPGAASKGASINFCIEEKKLRFEINLEAAKRAELEISSELLKLARTVKDEESK
jgi:hypothetical protein